MRRYNNGSNDYNNSVGDSSPSKDRQQIHGINGNYQDRSQHHLMYHHQQKHHRNKSSSSSKSNSNRRQGILNILLTVALIFEMLQVYKYECRLEPRNNILSSNSQYPGPWRRAAWTTTTATNTNTNTTTGPDDDRLQNGPVTVHYQYQPWDNSLPNYFFVSNDTQTKTESPFEPSPFNYSQPAIPTKYTLSEPNVTTNQSTIVIVLSARTNFEARKAIRQSWAFGHNNVYFVIGGPPPISIETNNNHANSTNSTTDADNTTQLLFQEQERFGDLLDCIHPDHYKSLPYKIHYAFQWISSRYSKNQIKWVLKVDDDVVVRLHKLQNEILQPYNFNIPMVIGNIATGSYPHKSGKWAEDPHYKQETYPPWAFGSAGYVVSSPIVQYLGSKPNTSNNNLYYYQGEDAGLGIWLDEAANATTNSLGKITFINHPGFHKQESCSKEYVVIGHDKTPQQIQDCFQQLGDEIDSTQKHVVYSTYKQKLSRDSSEDEEGEEEPVWLDSIDMNYDESFDYDMRMQQQAKQQQTQQSQSSKKWYNFWSSPNTESSSNAIKMGSLHVGTMKDLFNEGNNNKATVSEDPDQLLQPIEAE